MKRELRVIVLLAALTALAAAGCFLGIPAVYASSQSVYDEIEREGPAFTQAFRRELALADGGQFSLTSINGSVTLQSWDKPVILIEAVKRVEPKAGWFSLGAFSRADAEYWLDSIDIEVTAAPDKVAVTTTLPRRHKKPNMQVRYTIHAPRTVNVALETTNGKVYASHIEGEVRLRSTNGRVEVEHVRGPVSVNTTNGSVTCDAIQGDVAASSQNGSVTIEGVTGAVQARTTNGSIRVDHGDGLGAADAIDCKTTNGRITVALPEDSSFELDARKSNGSIHVGFPILTRGLVSGHERRRITGTVGSGGPLVQLQTTNGSIRIEST